MQPVTSTGSFVDTADEGAYMSSISGIQPLQKYTVVPLVIM
jgi:hypothetical protein